MKEEPRRSLPTHLLKELVLDSRRSLPLHAQLRSALERIIQDHFEEGSLFFSESELIRYLRISQGTIRRALTDLANQGLLEKRPAKGSIVHLPSKAGSMTNLAVFLPDYSSPTIGAMLGLLNAECLNRNIFLQPIYTHRGERLLKAYNALKFGPQEGAVVLLENSPRATVELVSALEDRGYRCVVIGTLLRHAPHRFVGGSNHAAIELGFQHLADLGHRHITLLVSEPEEKENVQERIEAFNACAKRSPKVQANVVRTGTHLWDDPYDAVDSVMRDVLQADKPPTAIFGISDVCALAAIRWLQKHQISVPEDISVIGTDGIEIGKMVHPALTTVSHPHDEMVRKVFELLDPSDMVARKIFVQPSLEVRESSAAPPKKQAAFLDRETAGAGESSAERKKATVGKKPRQ